MHYSVAHSTIEASKALTMFSYFIYKINIFTNMPLPVAPEQHFKHTYTNLTHTLQQ